ncbi:MAG: PhzF family phenazine biosynthesis isomerase, partial [Desulfocapsaceae bacterium]
MELPIYQIDAFASRLFEGNPAAVIPLQQWLPDDLLQAIAAENNVSETAYFLPDGDGFQIRWFTPVNEVDLCGHATLASAYVLFFILGYAQHKITFFSKSGILTVSHDKDLLIMDFPAQPPVPCEIPAELMQAFATVPTACLRSMDFIAVFKHERDIETAEPDFQQLMKLDLRGVIITAQSDRWDFVAR